MLWQLLSATGLFPEQDNLSYLPEFSEEKVREHASPSDCWIIINQLVYDVTDFLDKHAGGTEILWEHLGYDATLAFIQSGHSGAAYKMLAKFLIGRLRQPEAH
ncbi:cytochrome b5-like [Varroa jacobsoni]|uniref:Cytochrome b5 heme-binding domain-containing protein n=1 Tax=Varroa destructor TaxID=109461 RepID=A0A7M7MET1_VARDE|nr:cytochrome b5-like [Varroa destructor]XP_022706906.1 cytochrome b5-like [Varroa jacobsoni]